jgi:hypothetical protein
MCVCVVSYGKNPLRTFASPTALSSAFLGKKLSPGGGHGAVAGEIPRRVGRQRRLGPSRFNELGADAVEPSANDRD